MGFYCRNRKCDPKTFMESQGSQTAKSFLKKYGKSGGTHFSTKHAIKQ
jgi:hypothetical protein